MSSATPAILYAAKSTQDRHLSIPTQLAECRAMAEAEGWAVLAEYRDEGFSAYSGNRGPELRRAREHAAAAAAEAGGVTMLIAQAPDRFARGAGDRPGAAEALTEIWHATRRQNVHLRSVEEDYDLRSAGTVGNLSERTHGESKRKGTSVAKGMARRRERGLHTGGAVYGYDPDPELGLRPNANAATVRQIFQRVALGESQAGVARRLNEEGIRPLRAATWRQGSISKLLRTRAYRGVGAHEAIIGPELWEAAHAAAGRAAAKRGGGGGRRPNAGHLLTGAMLSHAVCDQAMVPRSYDRQRDGTVTGVYECSGRKGGLCEGLRVPMGAVDDAITTYLADVGLDAAASRRAIADAADSRRAATATQLVEARRELTNTDAAIARLRGYLRDGRLTPEEWRDHGDELLPERDAAAAHIAQLEAQSARLDAPTDVLPDVMDALGIIRAALAAGEKAGVRAALETLFDGFQIAELRDDDPPEADRDILTPGGRLVILPEPNRAALQSGAGGWALVDDESHEIFRRIPLPITDDNGLTT